MAKCDQGYLCVICGEEVKRIDQSELYLRYVLGWVDGNSLNAQPERHLRCSPAIAQFIVDEAFSPVSHEGPMDKRQLDAQFRAQREAEITRGFHRLQYLQKHRRNHTIDDYPSAPQ